MIQKNIKHFIFYVSQKILYFSLRRIKLKICGANLVLLYGGLCNAWRAWKSADLLYFTIGLIWRLTINMLLVRISPKLFGAFLIYAPIVFLTKKRNLWLKHHRKHEHYEPLSLSLGWFDVVSVAHVKTASCETSAYAASASVSSLMKVLSQASLNHHGNRPNLRPHNPHQERRPSKASDNLFALFKTQACYCWHSQEAWICC